MTPAAAMRKLRAALAPLAARRGHLREPQAPPSAIFWLGAYAALSLLPHLPRLPPWLIAVAVIAWIWRAGAALRGWRLPVRWLRWSLTLGLLALVHAHYGTLLGRDAGTVMLVGLLGLKFLELVSRRDFIATALLYQLVVLAAFLYAQSIWLGLYAVANALLMLACLMRVSQPRLPAPAALSLSTIMLAKAAPLMVLIYVFFPRVDAALWALPSDAYSGLSGIPETMRPGSINSLIESSEVAFRARFEGELPPPALRYWRVRVLSETDGKTWYQAAAGAAPRYTRVGAALSYEVTLEPSDRPWLPALERAFAPPPGAVLKEGYVLERRDPVRSRINYRLLSFPQHRDVEALRGWERRRAINLPRDLSARVRALAEGWRAVGESDGAVVRAALGHFRAQEFHYTLTPPLLGADPVDEFLFNTRRGFCEHYAAAFVTLMRAAGVPARVVVGYLGGERNPAGDYLIVRQSDAHAWAEVWLAPQGWVRVDPTAAVAPERVELGLEAVRRLQAQGLALGSLTGEALSRALELPVLRSWWLHARLYWDYANLSWYRWVIDYTQTRQERLLASLGFKNDLGQLAAVMAAGAGALLALYAGWLYRRRRVDDPVTRCYRRFCRRLARAGLIRRPGEGEASFAARCARLRPQWRASLTRVTDSYLALRYGPPERAPPLAELRAAVRAFRAR